jgi:hypothetical protein
MCPYKLYLATLSIYSQNVSLPTHTGIFSPQSGQRAQLNMEYKKNEAAS